MAENQCDFLSGSNKYFLAISPRIMAISVPPGTLYDSVVAPLGGKMPILSLNVAETSGGQGIFDGLESLPNHRIVADIEYLAAIRPDQQAGAID